jgi:hypothetical protein
VPTLICTVLFITPLLRDLTVEVVLFKQLQIRNRLHCAMRGRAHSQSDTASPNADIDDVSGALSASVRTIQRVFRREVGSHFESWRRQACSVIELLVSGLSLERLTLRLDTVCRRQLWKCFAEFRKRRGENGFSHCVFEIER